MNWTRCAATVATLTILPLTTGCAARAGAPFHIYGSPVLEGDHDAHAQETSHRRMIAATRDAEPARRTGSRPRRAVASAAPSRPSRARRAAPRPEPTARASAPASQDTPSLPSLSSVRLEREPMSAAGESPANAARYVWSELEANGVSLNAKARESVPALYRACAREAKVHFEGKKLRAGQVAFFHNTFDANGDGRNNDWYTHAAVVVQADGKGRATLAAFQDGGVVEVEMNLSAPGGEGNDQLRPRRDEDAPFTRYMTGELFAGSCAIMKGDDGFRANMAWRP
jgi:hypothetical protein